MRFLIVGCGSMGRRRARCLRKLGYDTIHAFDLRPDRLEAIQRESGVRTVPGFEDAIKAGVDFVLVCTPPHVHTPYLMRCIEQRLPVFCEAPITLTPDDADAVIAQAEAASVFIAPSCTYLHNRIHQEIKRFLDDNELGAPMAAVSHVGQHAADWHPYEDYREFYVSKRSQGGMCFDMLPHELHLFTHFFGEVQSLSCMARRRSRELVSDEGACDVYDVLLDMSAGVSVALHQDVVQRPWGEYRKIACERGAIEWNWHGLRVTRYKGPQFLGTPEWETIPFADYDFEDMYVAEVAHAIECIQSGGGYLMPMRRERHILDLALACERSSASGQHITFD
ncbi:MAG: Gfo/Idh/MocA family oxidoreductase [Candidatus Hydrogenedentes bacterium]|nr:Gfo/Idh/MocA family oxidoreductase [Candidatus Hydrogenedentota bacterium]